MQPFSRLHEAKLTQVVFADGMLIEKAAPEEVDEQQFYIQKVAFYLAHTLTWCKQLDYATELLINFDYSKKLHASRADHLIYNIENYYIRLNSLYDRVLQLVNAIFHLCVSEENVSHSVIISNHHVQHHSETVAAIKRIRKHLDSYAQTRHTLVHKHSLLDEYLRRIELYYMYDPEVIQGEKFKPKTIKAFRANYLREYVINKRADFIRINSELTSLMEALFEHLHMTYKAQRKIFDQRGF